jgi:hypothetical protein
VICKRSARFLRLCAKCSGFSRLIAELRTQSIDLVAHARAFLRVTREFAVLVVVFENFRFYEACEMCEFLFSSFL